MYHQKSMYLKDTAKGFLNGRYFTAITIVLLNVSLNFMLSESAVSFSDSLEKSMVQIFHTSANSIGILLVSYTLLFIINALLNIMSAGIALFFLNMACRRECNSFQLFHGYQQNFGKSFAISAVLTLPSTITTLPLNFAMMVYRESGTFSPSLFIGLMVSLLVCIAATLPLSLAVSQSFYLMLDYPDLSAIKIMKLSIKIMRGHKLQLLYLRLSFIPINLLNFLTFGFATLWVTPYQNTVYALYFLDLMRSPQTKEN